MDGRKVGHSFSKGLVDLYQRVIAGPTNSGVSFSAILVTLTPNWAGTSWPVAVCAGALKDGGLKEQRREKRPISVKAHGKSWLEHDQTTVNQSRLN